MAHFHDLLDVFFEETHRYNMWLDLIWPDSKIEDITPLHVTAQIGLAKYASHLIEKGEIVEKGFVGLPMNLAASRGHADVVQVLIDHGEDPNAELSRGLKPLHIAAESNYVDVVKVLLAAGVDPLTPKTKEDTRIVGCVVGQSCPNREGQTPLIYTCHAGHLETMAEFIPFLKNTEDFHKALHWAAEKGRSGIVDLILQQPGVDTKNKLRKDTNITLFVTYKTRDLETIELLIKAGADPQIFYESARSEFEKNRTRLPSATISLGDQRGSQPYIFCAEKSNSIESRPIIRPNV